MKKISINGKEMIKVEQDGNVLINIEDSLKKFNDHADKVNLAYAIVGFGVSQVAIYGYNEVVKTMATLNVGMDEIVDIESIFLSITISTIFGFRPKIIAGIDVVTGLRTYDRIKTIGKYLLK